MIDATFMMPLDKEISNNSVNGSLESNGQNKSIPGPISGTHLSSKDAPGCHIPKIAISSSKVVADTSVTECPVITPIVPSRSTMQPTGFMSFFSSRQRKSSGVQSLPGASVKQLRVVYVAKIDENIQAVDDLLDFHTRAVKAENKVSNALWHTVQYSKSRKCDTGSRTAIQPCYAGGHAMGGVLSPLLRPGAYSSGDNSAVDSGISEMTTDTPLFSRTNGLQGSTALQAKQFLRCFVDANESRAEISACRATFHKKITTFQLQLISESLQRLRSLYIEMDSRLETYSSQLEADVRECWKKYAKYADIVTRLRSRLNSLLEKGTASKRKTIESCVIELEAATQKLHLVHNTYALSLITARQYHRWLVTRLQPCLYRNLNRCLRLIDYGLSYLLRLARVDQAPTGTFDFLSPPEADPLGATTLDCSSEGGMGAPGDDTFRRAFPFDADLLVRAGDEALQPDKIVVDQLTFCHIQKLLQNHLQEAANQGSITRVLESEHGKLVASISSWVSVLSSSGSTLRDLPTIVKTDEAMTRLLEEVESLSPLESLSKLMADDEKLFLGTAMKPGTLCALAIQLGTCEFFHCQSVCFGDSHMQIVNVLREGNAVAPSPPLPTLTINATTNFSHPTAGDDGSIDMLESRFHCLRVQVDNQDGSVSGGRHSSVGESDSENEVIPQRQEHSPLVISPSSPPATPQRRSIKSIKEELYRQSLASLSKPSLTLTDSRSTNRHSVIATSKSPHRFSQGRFAKKDPPTSLLPDKDAFLKSRANSTSSVDVNHNASAPSTMLISPSQPPTGGELPSHRLDQEDVDINKEPWFHGVLPRTEVVRLLQNQGDFLVRETSKATSNSYLVRRNRGHRQRRSESPTSTNLWSVSSTSTTVITGGSSSTTSIFPSQSTEDIRSDRCNGVNGKVVVTKMVLSVYWNGHKHFIIQGGDEAAENGSGDLGNRRGGWSFEEYEFPTLRDLIEYHMRTGKPVTQSSGALLFNPISRPDWQLDNKDVILLEKIGQGNFGEVHRAIYNGREVAVKTCRAGPAEVEIRRKFLLGEATALNFFHPNIVRLLGIAVRSHPIMIVMEYVSGGSLLSFLRKSGPNADVRLLLRMSVDAASGMAYLESKNCIHRDLAARNCLLTEERVLKIADFGMAREEHVYELGRSAEEGESRRHKKPKKLSDRNGPIPIKWTAPEALYSNRYTSKCDVWSFGILLWEMFSGGDTPYHGLTNSETRDLVENGYRLAIPDRMPRQLGKHMQSCWYQNPNRRPTFASLVIALTQLKSDFDASGTSAVAPETLLSPSTSTAVPTSNDGTIQLGQVSHHFNQQQQVKVSEVRPTASEKDRLRPSALSASTDPGSSSSRLPRMKPMISDAPEEAAGEVDNSPTKCPDGERFEL